MTHEKQVIRIECEGATTLPIDDLNEMQGELKSLSQVDYERLKKQILEEGFSFSLHVWKDESQDKYFILDGHQRLRTVKNLITEGWECDELPVSFVHAPDYESAKRKLLGAASQYGKVESQGLYEFVSGMDLDLEYLHKTVNLRDINLTQFNEEYFKDTVYTEHLTPDIEVPDTPETTDLNETAEDTAPADELQEPDAPEIEPELIDEAETIPEVIEHRVQVGEVYHIGNHVLHNGDCLAVLKSLPDNHVHALVTDPPAGIAFMGKEWDEDKGGSKQWIAWMRDVMRECLRVMKPGAHGLVWAIPRTSHWTATALEDAGFEIRDVITHVFGSGFPKSLDISKAIDKAAGADRDVIGYRKESGPDFSDPQFIEQGSMMKSTDAKRAQIPITAPATEGAQQWVGWGTALKPASEHWILVRKPIASDTVAQNVLDYGTGGINIDSSRISGEPWSAHDATGLAKTKFFSDGETPVIHKEPHTQGRFPANFVLSHNPDCVEVGTKQVKSSPERIQKDTKDEGGGVSLNALMRPSGHKTAGYANEDGTETVTAFECTPGCAVAELDKKSGNCKSATNKKPTVSGGIWGVGAIPQFENGAPYAGEEGGASRFFYCAKPSKREKNEGCDDLEGKKWDYRENETTHLSPRAGANRSGKPEKNHHPTVKSLKLMTYLIQMVTPPGGLVLDCFGGSGTTMVAAHINGFSSILIEKQIEYCDIILARSEHITQSNAQVHS